MKKPTDNMPGPVSRYSEEAAGQRRQRNYAKWLAAALARHGEAFAYHDTRDGYRTQKSPAVRIYCNAHRSSFSIAPHDHLRYLGGGCAGCEFGARSRSKFAAEKAKFLAWFEASCADRLELASPFLGMTKDLSVKCREHGKIETTKPTNMMAGGSFPCRLCVARRKSAAARLSGDVLRSELERVMPDGVRISEIFFDETAGATRIRIDCQKHGVRVTDAAYLRTSAHKCPDCGSGQTGYAGYRMRKLLETGEEGRETWVGVMEIEAFGIRAMKVGISSRGLVQRYRSDLKKIFYSVRLMEIDALVLEARIRQLFGEHQDRRILMAGMRRGRRWSGDTELYWFSQKDAIARFAMDFVRRLGSGRDDYRKEIESLELFHALGRDVSREKNLSNLPRSVVCVDTGEHFPSIAQAARSLGISHGNLSMALAGRRRLAGGFRWAYAEDFERIRDEPLRKRMYTTKAVRCIETQEIFTGISEAARARGVSNSHITSVCRGKRRTAGGLHWEYFIPSDGLPSENTTAGETLSGKPCQETPAGRTGASSDLQPNGRGQNA